MIWQRRIARYNNPDGAKLKINTSSYLARDSVYPQRKSRLARRKALAEWRIVRSERARAKERRKERKRERFETVDALQAPRDRSISASIWHAWDFPSISTTSFFSRINFINCYDFRRNLENIMQVSQCGLVRVPMAFLHVITFKRSLHGLEVCYIGV